MLALALAPVSMAAVPALNTTVTARRSVATEVLPKQLLSNNPQSRQRRSAAEALRGLIGRLCQHNDRNTICKLRVISKSRGVT